MTSSKKVIDVDHCNERNFSYTTTISVCPKNLYEKIKVAMFY